MKKHTAKDGIPVFASEEEERRYWLTHDSTDHIDWRAAELAVFSRLKPTTKAISLRLPEALLAEIKTMANKRDVPYQSLIKMILAERLQRERGA